MIPKRTLAIAAFLTVLVTLLTACATNSSNRRATPTPVPTLVKYEPSIFKVERAGLVSEKSVQLP